MPYRPPWSCSVSLQSSGYVAGGAASTLRATPPDGLIGDASGRLERLIVVQGDHPGPWAVQRFVVDGVSALVEQDGVYDGQLFAESSEKPQPIKPGIVVGPSSIIELQVSNLARRSRILHARVFVAMPAQGVPEAAPTRVELVRQPVASPTAAEVAGLVRRPPSTLHEAPPATSADLAEPATSTGE